MNEIEEIGKVQIKKGVLDELLQACRNTHPNEFFAFLGSADKKVVDEYIVVPLFYQAPDSISYRTDLLPFDLSVIGSIHSHPSHNPYPSRADNNSFFQRGQYHIIITYPYNYGSIYAYSKESNPLRIEIV
jgi:proteasome lid subunit RPN8/RPN11